MLYVLVITQSSENLFQALIKKLSGKVKVYTGGENYRLTFCRVATYLISLTLFLDVLNTAYGFLSAFACMEIKAIG